MNLTDVSTDAPVVIRTGEKDSPLLLFSYQGRTFATNLFRMHDQEGFSLTDSFVECRKRGWHPCIQQFVADALRAGWPRDRAERIVREAERDSIC